MSATTPPVGIDHPTVVPANFDPDEDAADAPAEDGDATDGA
jgi:hypothetical protein